MKRISTNNLTFITIWLGQLVSLFGSSLTSFALGVWLFQRTGSITQFALIGFFSIIPRLILSPLIGVFVDRWDRRWAMILSDAGAGLGTLFIVSMLATDQLQVWHIYLVSALNAVFSTIQWPAYMATMSLLVYEKNLGRANGLVQFGQAASEILAPLLAGVLIGVIHLQGVILIDMGTCLFAILTLLLVSVPKVIQLTAADSETGSLWRQMGFGWRYIRQQPDLLFLLGFFVVVNFLWGMVGALINPLILPWTSSSVLGAIVSIAGLGMFAGSLLMSVWGGPRNRISGIILFEFISGICYILMGIRPAFWPVAIGAFGAHVTIAVVYGCNTALWQSRTAPEIQGRVLATQQMVVRLASPLAYLLAGPLAERLFDPLLSSPGPFSQWLKLIVGSQAGRGAGLIFVLMGLVKISISWVAIRNQRLYLNDDEPSPGQSHSIAQA